ATGQDHAEGPQGEQGNEDGRQALELAGQLATPQAEFGMARQGRLLARSAHDGRCHGGVLLNQEESSRTGQTGNHEKPLFSLQLKVDSVTRAKTTAQEHTA